MSIITIIAVAFILTLTYILFRMGKDIDDSAKDLCSLSKTKLDLPATHLELHRKHSSLWRSLNNRGLIFNYSYRKPRHTEPYGMIVETFKIPMTDFKKIKQDINTVAFKLSLTVPVGPLSVKGLAKELNTSTEEAERVLDNLLKIMAVTIILAVRGSEKEIWVSVVKA